MVDDKSKETSKFDFNTHSESAISEYRKIRPNYEKFTQTAKKMISDILRSENLKCHSIEARAKEIDEFGKKAAKSLKSDTTKPKYPNPLSDITDMAGVRVITFLPRTVEGVCKLIEREFEILEKTDKATKLMDEGKIGYQSVHYLVKMRSSRTHLPEYKPYEDLILEIQVRTILQHAWAEMEHGIQYKNEEEIPTLVKRRFTALAGLLDIADREFQTLQEEYEQKKKQQGKEIERHMKDLNISPDKDYAKESLEELILWIGSDEYREKLRKGLDKISDEYSLDGLKSIFGEQDLED
ncbi:MAG TPA: RelA/SpoT domain-containing protein [Methanotrichaceae archaeon]|nr:RelA/SpoT domain-containing protein [Methanotrichaceae archaeon]